jgi:hypothetical protein
LTTPDGVELGRFKPTFVAFNFDMKDARRNKLCTVIMARKFSEKGI